jgi:hypothetical protein
MPSTQAKSHQLSDDARFILNEFNKRFQKLEDRLDSKSRTQSAIPETLQPTEVCKKMGWSRSKFEQFKRGGLFRTFKIGGKVYVYTSDLKALFPKDFF